LFNPNAWDRLIGRIRSGVVGFLQQRHTRQEAQRAL
jgi:hypothetical protein